MVSSPTRYLVFFQYFGTKYSGVMETSNDQSMVGVQNYLEKAAQNLKPVVPIKFCISSRTDTGVHALCNSAHLDIQRAPGKPAFSEKQLVYSLNYHLKPEPIRYLNVPAMQDAAQFLLGTHDFSTFRSLNSETPFQSPVRTILQADIRPSSGFLSQHYEDRCWLLLPSGKRQLDFLLGTGVLGVEVQRQIISLPTGPKNGWGSSCSWPGKVNTSSYKGVTGDKRFTGFSIKCHGSAIWTLSKISGI
ncbi:tRNA pseudouridine synthase-like 1 isoform 5-T6 [Spheniscus humboldti]